MSWLLVSRFFTATITRTNPSFFFSSVAVTEEQAFSSEIIRLHTKKIIFLFLTQKKNVSIFLIMKVPMVQISKYLGHKFVNIFSTINLNIYLWCLKENCLSVTFEYPQNMLWLRNKEISVWIHILICRPKKDHWHLLWVNAYGLE